MDKINFKPKERLCNHNIVELRQYPLNTDRQFLIVYGCDKCGLVTSTERVDMLGD